MRGCLVSLLVLSLGVHVASASGGQGGCIAAREDLHRAVRAVDHVKGRVNLYNDLVDVMTEIEALRLKADILEEKEKAEGMLEKAFKAAEGACKEE